MNCKPILPQLKTIEIPSNNLEKIGEDWLITRVTRYILGIYFRMDIFKYHKKLNLVYSIICLMILLGYTIFNILIIILDFKINNSLYHIVNILILIFGILYFVLLLLSTIKAYQNKELNENVIKLYTCTKWIYYPLVIIMSASMLWNNILIFGSIFTSSIFAIDLINALRVTFIILSTPAIILLSLFESIFRFLVCRLNCPYMKQITKSYTYKLYIFGQGCALNKKECSICLRDYTEGDNNLVVLKCLGKHVFHEGCILEWVKKQDSCPLCRANISFNIE